MLLQQQHIVGVNYEQFQQINYSRTEQNPVLSYPSLHNLHHGIVYCISCLYFFPT